ncbi:MAG TPA: DUF222 domain-containing protein [Microbacterium sp.]|nr:DUF222 domain-containing protein [Microbacterium sp.]
MNTAPATLLEALDRVSVMLADASGPIAGDGAIRTVTDVELRELTQKVESLGRQVDALRVACAGEIDDRSRPERGSERMSAQHGCANSTELLVRLTRVSARTATSRIRLGKSCRSSVSLTGEALPARFPAVQTALTTGQLGLDAAAEITRGLTQSADRADPALLAAAEAELVQSATGTAPDGAPAAGADDIRIQVKVWSLVLDPDGVLPDYERAMRRRTLTVGRERDNLVPLHGNVLPDVAAQLMRLAHAHNSPRVDDRTGGGPAFREDPDADGSLIPHDERTSGQKLHDVLATILGVAARAAETPSIGGAAPTLQVTIPAEDLDRHDGIGFVDGTDTTVPAFVARQIACTGGIQTLTLSADNRIVQLGSPERVFNRRQRRAMIARDGQCIIPGCHVPAEWCEFHHVVDYAKGGPTHTDNGVALCWWHHRTLETSGWLIRMVDGVPEVRAPYYIDPQMLWRRVPPSPQLQTQRRRRGRAPT